MRGKIFYGTRRGDFSQMRRTLRRAAAAAAILGLLGRCGAAARANTSVTFAMIGDYGQDYGKTAGSIDPTKPGQGAGEIGVATMVNSWNPSFIISNGDNNYGDDGSNDNYTNAAVIKNDTQAYDAATGTYLYGNAISSGNFYPVEGNADWGQEGGVGNSASWFGGAFNLPPNANTSPVTGASPAPGVTEGPGGYYYTFTRGTVGTTSQPMMQFFMLSGDQSDPSLVGTDSQGNTGDATAAEVANSAQGQWLRNALLGSDALYKLVVVHFPPYSSLNDGGQQSPWMALPYQAWGASAVFSGHAHAMEALYEPDSGPGGSGATIPYFINGTGGRGYDDGFNSPPVAGSQWQWAEDYGAFKAVATPSDIKIFPFAYDISGGVSPISLQYSYNNGTAFQSNFSAAATGNYSYINVPATAFNYTLASGAVKTAGEIVGYSNSGSFTQTGGSNTVTNGGAATIYLGYAVGGAGTYALSGGTLNADNLVVGASGSGTFTQTGGTVTVSSQMTLAENAGGAGAYDLYGGTLNAAAIEINTGGVLNLNNGAAAQANNGVLNTPDIEQEGGNFLAAEYISTGIFHQIGGAGDVTGALTGAGNLTVGGTFIVGSFAQNSVAITGTGILTVTAGTTPNAVVNQADSLSLSTGGTLDLNNSSVIIHGANVNVNNAVRAYLASGYNGGKWNGPGIISSAAAASGAAVTGVTTLGYANGADGVVAGLASGNELIKYTLAGDADLDGKVDFSDFLILESNFGHTGAQWDQGDFNYDGTVTFQDFLILESNFGKSLPGAGSVMVTSQQLATMATFAKTFGGVVIPEPGTLVLLATGALALVWEKRKRAA